MPDNNITALGFDFGTSWIGTAVGQSRTQTASPLKPIRNMNSRPDWEGISELIRQWQPDRLIVGLPLTMNGENTDVTERTKRFGRQLEGRFRIKTEFIDERLTTREAWQIVQHKASQHVSKRDIDSIAAVLITETWFSSHSD